MQNLIYRSGVLLLAHKFINYERMMRNEKVNATRWVSLFGAYN